MPAQAPVILGVGGGIAAYKAVSVLRLLSEAGHDVTVIPTSSALQFGISILGVVIFTGLTAYDTQRIRADYVQHAYAEGTDGAAKRSVFDALSLYLNFINLFMMLLQLLGNRRQ